MLSASQARTTRTSSGRFLSSRLSIALTSTRPAVAPRLVDDGVHFGQGDQVDVGEARVPRAGDDGVEPIDGCLRLAGVGERQAEVAVRLRLVRRQLEDALEHRHRGVDLARLLQPIGEQAQHLAVLQVELGQVGERAQAESAVVAVALGKEELGRVEEEADARLVGAPLVEVDARPVVGRAPPAAA